MIPSVSISFTSPKVIFGVLYRESVAGFSFIVKNCLSKLIPEINDSLSHKQIFPLEREIFRVRILSICSEMHKESHNDSKLQEKVTSDLTPIQMVTIAIDFLISTGLNPLDIESTFSKAEIELPSSAYTDRGVLKALGHQSWMGSVRANAQAIQKIGTQWIIHNWASILGTCAVVEMVSRFPIAVAATSCEAPEGSYRQTCKVKSATPYRSTDPHLKEIEFCQFSIDCETLDWEKSHTNTKTFAKEDIACLTAMKNCDGHLIPRMGNEQLCIDPERAKYYSKRREEL